MKQYTHKDFNDITVKGLCAAVPVARTTFYSYYNNTDDVRQEIEDLLIRGLVEISETISSGSFPDMDFSLLMDETEKYIRQHWSEIHAFLVCQPNLRFIRKWKDAIKVNFSRRFPEKCSARSYDAVAEIVASSMISIYTYWLEHPDTTSPEEVKPLLRRLVDSLVTLL